MDKGVRAIMDQRGQDSHKVDLQQKGINELTPDKMSEMGSGPNLYPPPLYRWLVFVTISHYLQHYNIAMFEALPNVYSLVDRMEKILRRFISLALGGARGHIFVMKMSIC